MRNNETYRYFDYDKNDSKTALNGRLAQQQKSIITVESINVCFFSTASDKKYAKNV